MRRAVIAAVAGVAVIAGSSGALGNVGTFAGFTDSESNAESTVTAATVVLAGHGTPVSLAYPDLRDGVARTVELPVENRGTVPVRAELLLPSGPTETSCTFDGSRWDDGPSAGTLTVQVGQGSPVAYCSLLDGGPRILAATVAPGATVHVPITVTASGLPDLTRTERAPVVLRAAGGFTDHIPGTIEITAGGTPAALAAPVAEPEPAPAITTTEAATEAAVPDGGADRWTCDAEPGAGALGCGTAPVAPASTSPTPASSPPTSPSPTSPSPTSPRPSSPAPTPSGTTEVPSAADTSIPEQPRKAAPQEADTSEPVEAADATATGLPAGPETVTTEPPTPEQARVTLTPPTAESEP